MTDENSSAFCILRTRTHNATSSSAVQPKWPKIVSFIARIDSRLKSSDIVTALENFQPKVLSEETFCREQRRERETTIDSWRRRKSRSKFRRLLRRLLASSSTATSVVTAFFSFYRSFHRRTKRRRRVREKQKERKKCLSMSAAQNIDIKTQNRRRSLKTTGRCLYWCRGTIECETKSQFSSCQTRHTKKKIETISKCVF